jgi:hypothetical protein
MAVVLRELLGSDRETPGGLPNLGNGLPFTELLINPTVALSILLVPKNQKPINI